MNGYDSVFALANDKDLEFDAMFDEDEELVDIVCGYNENGDPLTGADNCPAATAEERSCDDCNPDYDKDIDADDSKDAPKDAEGTVGYEFEEKPEIDGKVDDSTKPEAEEVEGESDYQEKEDSDKGVEDTVTSTIENDKDVMEAYFQEVEDAIGYKETETEEERITDAPEVKPDDIEDTAKEVAKENDATDAEEVVKNDDKGVEDTVTGTIENDKDVMEAYFQEVEDALSGQDTNPEVNAKERSCDDCNPDYDKDIDADDSKDAPKDAEGTVGYEFEEKPEIDGKVDDSTTVDPKDVKIDEEVDYEFDTTIPKDAEGTVGYEFEVNPEIGCKDDQSTVDEKDVKVEEEVDYDIPQDADGAVKTVPEVDPTEVEADCGDANPTVGYDFEEAAELIDKDVEKLEEPDEVVGDNVLDDVESDEKDPNLEYDVSDEDLIDYAINN